MELEAKKSKAPIILGVLSLIAWLIPILGLIISGFGIVISSKNIKKYNCKAYKIGFVLSIIGLILAIGYFALSYYLIMNGMV
ncbi:Uncharacterised protein [[Clostridium] sordellii]|uniref:Membrane protein n=1 Tax=Paraclostridium sordellii TaxID=1505 RepID=A0A9P1KXZ7_PARSO|nr:hypothetical protein [Paeniclostridium sordellii]EPZ58541.1 putative membrane protein [[Clostridium] sordellii ATCC 9714] [Paeniclostridium sordellii ATCC 9714]CEJ72897.1 putative membrane protein [[Clostridium] sordellii] [Paeniclostridium sordellii]CEK34996.1 hypothetical protein UMC2_19521 [[Clostridium] sordellii] [Paeniclostridium sordellii]CEN68450.1 Uncharacterised protein [[Clostridium] sordellii] [Paeniclostridium sordellii]CEN71717.1 Uncharacterised protein [[Clostridium] sordelli